MTSKDNNGAGVYEVLAFTLIGKDAAKNAVDDIKSSDELAGYKVLAAFIISKDENGKVHTSQPSSKGKGAGIGAATGAFLGLIGGPAGLLAWMAAGTATGAVVGSKKGHPVSKEEIKEIGDALTPDSSAFLLLLEDRYSEGVINNLPEYNADVVTYTLGDEASGEIDQYVDGEVDKS